MTSLVRLRSTPHRRPQGRQSGRRAKGHGVALSLLASLAALAAAGAPSQLQAQTWAGLGFGNGWSDPLNWQGVAVPLSSASTSITFAGTRRPDTVQNIVSPFNLNALTFASGAAGFTISGNALRFAGSSASLVQNASNPVTLAVPIQIVEQLVYSGNGSASFKGPLSSANANPQFRPQLVKRGTGRLTLTEPSSFNGLVSIEAGQLRVENAQALPLADVTLAVDNGLDLSGVASVSLGGLSGSGALALGTTQLTVGGSGSTPAVYSGNITATTGTLTKTGVGFSDFSGTSSLAALGVDQGGAVLRGGTMTLTNTAQGLRVGTGGGAAPGTVVALELHSGAVLNALGTTVQVDGASSTNLRVLGSGSRLNTGFQTLVGNFGSGRLLVADGGSVVAGTFLVMAFNNGSQGLLDVQAGGSVTSPAGLLGTLTGATGTAIVSGAGGRWDNSIIGLGGVSTSQRGGTGTLIVGPGGLVTASDTLTFWSATSTLRIEGGQVQVGRLASDGALGSVELLADGSAGAALQITGASGTPTFAGVISGAGSLRKTGGSVQTLAGANTFSGSTTVAGGRIVLGNPLALQNSTVVLDVDGGLDLAGLAEATVGNLAGSGALALGTSVLRTGNNGAATVHAGTLTGTTGYLIKVGSGTSTLSGSGSSFSGLSVNSGTLRLSGGSMQLSSVSRGAFPAIAVGGGGLLDIADGAVISPDGPGDSSVFVDGVAGTRLSVSGTGTRLNTGFQTIAGNAAQGEIALRNGAALTARFALVSGFADGSHGTLTLESGARATAFIASVGTLAGATGSALVTGAGTVLEATGELGLGGFSSGQNGGSGTLTLRDGGLATAPRTVFWNADTRVRIDGGQLLTAALVGTAAGSEIELVADPALGAALTLTTNAGVETFLGRVSGSGGVLKSGAGTQVLGGDNRFTGAVNVTGGTLRMASGAASEYLVSPGARLQLGERNLGAAVVQAPPGATVAYTAPTLSGGLLLGAGTHDISAVQRIVGTQVSNGVTLQPAAGTALVGVANSGLIANAAGRSLSWTGGGNPVGTLTVAGSTSLSAFSSGGLIQVLPGGTLSNTGTDLLLAGGSRTLIGSAAAPGGTLRLPDASRVQLNGGLLVNNGTLDGALNVNFGALAKGAGTFGAVTVTDGGRFSPGNSPGTARSASATWAAGGGYLVELGAAAGTAGEHWDLWRIDGLLDITAGTTTNSRFTLSLLTLDASGAPGPLTGFDPMRAWAWQIVDTGAGVAGFDMTRLALDTSGFASATAGGSFSLALSEGDLYLQFAPIPEPGTWALLLGGLAGVGWVAARRGRRAR